MPEKRTPLIPDAAHREQFLSIVEAALRAVDPADAVRAHLRVEGDRLRLGDRDYALSDVDRIVVVGGGKACAPMAAALSEALGDRITAGVVTVKRGHTGPGFRAARFGAASLPGSPMPPASTGRIAVVEAAHPVPDAAGVAGVARMLDLLAGLTRRDLVIVLLSGGGSALLPAPADGLRLEDLQETTDLLLACGATITEINAVRKHCSRLAGGQLARLASPARVETLLLSDVVGSPLDAIASGPTSADPTTFSEARSVLTRYALLERVPAAVRDRIERGCSGELAETPKPGDPLFDRVHHVIVGDNARAARAACAQARQQGWNPLYLGSRWEGEAREVGRVVAGLGVSLAWGEVDLPLPACLVLGGETTVTLRGKGTGGRNQELALAAALALDRAPRPESARVAVVSVATDGNDGPTEAAGALATAETVAQARQLGLDPWAALAANDSLPLWSALADLLLTGPTGTNVNDLILLFAWSAADPPLEPNRRRHASSRGDVAASAFQARADAGRTHQRRGRVHGRPV
ncbi:MAG: DUF4147 domain-containing protein [Deltaproteobacteria bacterium]|nr:DUF4147 domain-containing protein [Deltaproteobacteria bacterium]